MVSTSQHPKGSTIAPSGRESRTGRYTVKMGDEVIGKAVLRSVPVPVIRIDTAYQRDTNSEWVEQHRPFDARQAGAIVLSSRAGGPYVIDGGHRLALARRDGVPTINAFIIEGLAQRDEARLFTRYQRERRNLTSWAMWRADLVAGDQATLDIQRIVTAHGFEITDAPGEGHIQAISALRSVYTVHGPETMGEMLELVRRHWYGEHMSLTGQLMRGLGTFLHSARGDAAFRPDRLDRVLERLAPARLLRLSMAVSERWRGRSSTGIQQSAIAEALREEYNKTWRTAKLEAFEYKPGPTVPRKAVK